MLSTPVTEVTMVKQAKRKDTTSYHKRYGEIKYISVLFQALFFSFICCIFVRTYLKDTVYNAHFSSWVSAVEYNSKIISQNFYKNKHKPTKQTNRTPVTFLLPFPKENSIPVFFRLSLKCSFLCIEQQVNTYITAVSAVTYVCFSRDHEDWDNYILQEAKQFMKKNYTYSY